MKNNVLRIVALGGLLVAASASLIACNSGPAKGMKVGLIALHSASSSTYDKNFVEAFRASAKKLGFTAVVREVNRKIILFIKELCFFILSYCFQTNCIILF